MRTLTRRVGAPARADGCAEMVRLFPHWPFLPILGQEYLLSPHTSLDEYHREHAPVQAAQSIPLFL